MRPAGGGNKTSEPLRLQDGLEMVGMMDIAILSEQKGIKRGTRPATIGRENDNNI